MTESGSGTPTAFLDRDGVLNRRIIDDYVTDWSEFVILPGAVDAVVALNRAGYRCVVVTNQRGIAIGRMSAETVAEIHQRFAKIVAEAGGKLDEFYVCPHDRHVGCPCRKPRPGLLDQAHQHSPVDFSRSLLIGDSDSDILAGQARGVATIKVAGPSSVSPSYEAVDLGEAVRLWTSSWSADTAD